MHKRHFWFIFMPEYKLIKQEKQNMIRNERLKIIREIVSSGKISSQENLVEELKNRGYDVTQATVSRDMQFLNLVKVRNSAGSEYYSISGSYTADPQFNLTRVKAKFRENVLMVRYAGNLIVIRTHPGEAQGVAAVIDGSNFSEILGTVAGDDTIVCVAENQQAAKKMSEFFADL